jgi:hypothetical protein
MEGCPNKSKGKTLFLLVETALLTWNELKASAYP